MLNINKAYYLKLKCIGGLHTAKNEILSTGKSLPQASNTLIRNMYNKIRIYLLRIKPVVEFDWIQFYVIDIYIVVHTEQKSEALWVAGV